MIQQMTGRTLNDDEGEGELPRSTFKLLSWNGVDCCSASRWGETMALEVKAINPRDHKNKL